MAILKNTLLLPLTLLLTGCYEDFTPDIDIKPVLCLNSLITPGQPIEVSVTHTWLYTDENAAGDNKVMDASILIYANGKPVSSDYLPREGDKIRIYAESPAYGQAEGEVTVPVAATIESVVWDPVITNLLKADTADSRMMADISFNLSTKLTFKDSADTENYYNFSYLGFNPSPEPYEDDNIVYLPFVNFTLGSMNYNAEPIFREHIGAFESVTGSDAYGFTCFSDRQFSGKNYTLNIVFENMNYYVKNDFKYDEALLDCGLTFTLSTVSASFYNWAIYHWHGDNMIGDLSGSGLGDPIWGYSNVSTGAGVIAAMAHSSATISIEPFLAKAISSPQ